MYSLGYIYHIYITQIYIGLGIYLDKTECPFARIYFQFFLKMPKKFRKNFWFPGGGQIPLEEVADQGAPFWRKQELKRVQR